MKNPKKRASGQHPEVAMTGLNETTISMTMTQTGMSGEQTTTERKDGLTEKRTIVNFLAHLLIRKYAPNNASNADSKR